MNDKKRALLNIITSVGFRIILVVLHIFVVKSMDNITGATATGYNSLFTSIISVLSLAECGFSGGIAFCLYGAITKNDQRKIIGLYNLIRRFYRIVFIIVLGVGLALTPLLPFLNSNTGGLYEAIPLEIYFSYMLYILSAAASYLYSYKGVIIAAYKNNYKKDFATSLGTVVSYSLIILLAVLTNNFLIVSSSLLVGTAVSFVLFYFIFKKDHLELINKNDSLDKEEKKEVLKYVSSVFVHVVGDVVIYSTDSIIISAFLGTDTLGDYYHYQSIINAIFSVTTLAFTSITSIIGHYLSNNEDSEKKNQLFKIYYYLNFAIGSVIFLGFYGASEAFVNWIYGGSMNIMWYVLMALTFCYFTRFMQRTMQTARDAGGTFIKDVYRPIIESVINIVLDIILVQYLGILGVLIATIAVNILISHVIEPYIGFKYVIKKSPTRFYIINYLSHIIFCGEIAAIYFIKEAINPYFNAPILFFILGSISVVLASLVVLPNLVLIIKKIKMMNGTKPNNIAIETKK